MTEILCKPLPQPETDQTLTLLSKSSSTILISMINPVKVDSVYRIQIVFETLLELLKCLSGKIELKYLVHIINAS